MTSRPTFFFLYGCEKCYFTLRTEHKLQVLENKLARKMGHI